MPVYFNNQFQNDKEAFLYATDLSIQRGYAVFDFFRTKYRRPLFMQDHLDRFFQSAAAMHLQMKKSKDEIEIIIGELIDQSSFTDAGIRLLLTGGYSSDTYNQGEPNLIISSTPLIAPPTTQYEKGYDVITYEHQRELPEIKNTNYVMGIWLQPLLKERKANDVLYFNNNIITEFPRANVFIITKEKVLITPSRNILYGVTRKQVLKLAKEFIATEEKDITIKDLMQAEEVFLTSTTKKIMPIVKIDGQRISDGHPGAITKQLYQQFLKLEQQ